MKKVLLMGITLLVLVFACAGCGSGESSSEAKTDDKTEVAVTEKGDSDEKSGTDADNQAQSEEVKPEPIIEGSGTYEEITQEQAKEIMDDEEPAVILDVRSYEEYEAGHIDGALCFPLEGINENSRMMIEQLIPRKDQTILVYDNDAERSKKGAQVMADIGYTNVKEFGQIGDWQYGTVEE